MNKYLLGFYGDDFTGSTDVLEALTRGGLRTVCFVNPPNEEDLIRFEGLQAFGIAGMSRTMTPEQMDTELLPAFETLRNLNAPLIHYKTCSTFDSSPKIGSIGKAIDIGSEVFSFPYVPVVVGAPILGRYVLFANVFARSGLDSDPYRLDRHPTMSRHPVTPMSESDLRLHLAKQTNKTSALFDVLHLNLSMKEVEAAFEQLKVSNPEIIIFDTLEDSHLPKIGKLLVKDQTPETPLFIAGSSGVEYCLSAYWQQQNISTPKQFNDPGEVAQTLIVSGSCSPVTAGQIEWAVNQGDVDIAVNTSQLLKPETYYKECKRIVTESLANLDQGANVIVHTSCGPNDPRIQEVNHQIKSNREFSEIDTSKLFGEALGNILLSVLEKKPLQRVATTGGDTSGYIARTIGVEAIEMLSPLNPGSPLCYMYKSGSPLDGLQITFKGGQVGKKDYFHVVKRGIL